ncbi:MAG: hypothetical protein B7Z05_05710 [Thiotrichales bacterium 32-46-8]|nr:hypothetical protein [Gammaproteobacteria bacterium]OYX05865.1 MAG: hypothetical protein B7Z05_05710 [Thiotrichales bacterium 32-46-8]OYZ05387.1 MAG: hypothetical protein B7Y29_06395 [Thiotrichales bacterium 16-46-22]OZA96917.1 MAG: hypothetical protein B7X52_04120 [Thiotrichales bacterium 34-46-19]HQT04967.1 hypothetical protein [Thiotrichales bacterium]
MRTKKPTPPNVNELLTKLTAIELQRLDVQQQLIQLRAGKDLNFFIIPVTVLILLAGVAIGLNLGSMIWGFVAGAALALLVGYAYHLWDVQWQKAATDQVLAYINELEGEQGFLPWFKPLLAKQNYRRLFYKLNKQGQVEIDDYVRAIKRLQQKDTNLLLTQLQALYPEPIESNDSQPTP